MKSSNDALLEDILSKVRESILRAWQEGSDPVACILQNRNRRQVSDAVLMPKPEPIDQGDMEAHCLPDDPSECQHEDDDTLTDTDELILSVLRSSGNPLKVSSIAVKAKRKFNGYFRSRIYRLVRLKKIIQLPDSRYQLVLEQDR